MSKAATIKIQTQITIQNIFNPDNKYLKFSLNPLGNHTQSALIDSTRLLLIVHRGTQYQSIRLNLNLSNSHIIKTKGKSKPQQPESGFYP